MSLSTEQEVAADAALVALRAELASAYAQVGGARSSLLSYLIPQNVSASKGAVLSNLDADGARIERLAGELRDQVRNDELDWGNWVGIAETTHQDIAYQQGLTGEWSMSGVLRSALSATGEQLGNAALNGPPTWMMVTGGVLAALIALHYLSPLLERARPRRVAGLRRRR